MKRLILLLLVFSAFIVKIKAQQKVFEPVKLVNVFLGTSGDHGQLSPAAGSPFGMMSLGPQTYPNLHAGYEHSAKEFLGFTHNRFEGVGCTGSGGLLLVKPFVGDENAKLLKTKEDASPGYYHVAFENKIDVKLTAGNKSGVHRYVFPRGKKGLIINLAHAFSKIFVAEEHQVNGNSISGWIDAKTTCKEGKYRVYYQLNLNQQAQIETDVKHQLKVNFGEAVTQVEIRVGFSAINADYARLNSSDLSFESVLRKTQLEWNEKLSTIKADGDLASQRLFYSLLYRTMQSPYLISEKDGTFKINNGTVKKGTDNYYNGWAKKANTA